MKTITLRGDDTDWGKSWIAAAILDFIRETHQAKVIDATEPIDFDYDGILIIIE